MCYIMSRVFLYFKGLASPPPAAKPLEPPPQRPPGLVKFPGRTPGVSPGGAHLRRPKAAWTKPQT